MSLTRCGRRASAGGERYAEIAKHLIRLGGEIVSADDLAGHIERGLACDEDHAAGVDLHHL